MRGFLTPLPHWSPWHEPGRLVVCLDLDWRPTFPHRPDPSYKAHRVETAADDQTGVDVEEVPDAR